MRRACGWPLPTMDRRRPILGSSTGAGGSRACDPGGCATRLVGAASRASTASRRNPWNSSRPGRFSTGPHCRRPQCAAGRARSSAGAGAAPGYDGPIALAFDKLPPGVTLEGNEIPAGASGTLVVLKGSIPLPLHRRNIARHGQHRRRHALRTARFEQHALGALQPWLQGEVALAVAPAAAEPFTIRVRQPSGRPKIFVRQQAQAADQAHGRASPKEGRCGSSW